MRAAHLGKPKPRGAARKPVSAEGRANVQAAQLARFAAKPVSELTRQRMRSAQQARRARGE